MEHFFINKSFSNFDEFANAAQAWDLDFKQLDPLGTIHMF